MSESMWKSEVEEEAQQEAMPEEQAAERNAEYVAEATAEPRVETSAVTLSVDEFSALEERIQRTVNLVKHERQARVAAEERANTAEAQISKHAPMVEQMQAEIQMLRTERGHVRQRVERLLAQLDALEL
jgi:DNA repair exonuclease SbcCD ATPase subunit